MAADLSLPGRYSLRSRVVAGAVFAALSFSAILAAAQNNTRSAPPNIKKPRPAARPTLGTGARATETPSIPLFPVPVTKLTNPAEPPGVRVIETFGRLPLSFEPNHGQTDAQVKFLSRGRGYTLFLTGQEAVLSLRKPSAVSPQRSAIGNPKFENPHSSVRNPPVPSTQHPELAFLRMKLVGANANAQVVGTDELPGKSNYFIGNDPKKWRTNVPNYAKVKYRDIYPGIDLVYYGDQRQLEYDFVVAPGANPKAIRLAVVGEGSALPKRETAGAQRAPLHIAANGDLVIETEGGEIRLRKPVVYQSEAAVGKHLLNGHYVLTANRQVSFDVTAYDRTKPLVIDPVVSYSTFFGGTGNDYGNGIAVDSAGNAYVTGSTASADFPTLNPARATFSGIQDVFVAKFNPAASGAASLLYSTYLGATLGGSTGSAIAIDSAGNTYITGLTTATNFPTTPGAFQTSVANPGHAFVAKLGPTGSVLVYSTYLGGSVGVGVPGSHNLGDTGNGIAVDSAGEAYVTGTTNAPDFPTTSSAFQTSFGGGAVDAFVFGASDAFMTKLNAAGSALVYSTYLGGSGNDLGDGIAVDALGNAYVTGATGSSNFPTTVGALQTTLAGVEDAFVTKFNPAASGAASLIYSTYLGNGISFDLLGLSIAVDSAGNAYVTGGTSSSSFPTTPGAFQTSLAGGTDTFVTKLNAAGSALVYSTYLGGSDTDQPYGIAVDSQGNAFVTGQTFSLNFPTANPTQATTHGFGFGLTGFITKFNATGSALIFSTYLGGGSGVQGSKAISVDPLGNIYVTGSTETKDFPTVNAFQGNCALAPPSAFGVCSTDAFVTKISGFALPSVTWSPASLTFSSQVVGTTSAAQTVTLTNNGTSALTITSITASGDFAQTNTCGTSIAAGANCAINVTFTPSARGARNGTVTITDNAAGSPQTVALTGTGVAPIVGLSATSLTFASQTVSSSSSAQSVTLSNTGDGPLNISSVAVSADFAQSNTCGSSVAAGANCTINVTFTPTAVGSRVGTLSISDNAQGSPHTVALSGTGADFSVSPASGSSTAATVAAGQAASYTLSLAGAGGFNGTVSLTCSDAPPASICNVSPSSAALTASSPLTATVTVTTTARALVPPRLQPSPPAKGRHGGLPLPLLVVALATLAGFMWAGRRRASPLAIRFSLAATMLSVLLWAACGGGGGGGGGGVRNPGTPAGTYTLTVTATFTSGSATLKHDVKLTLTVL